MIVTRTPFRISFLGGGTDYPAWYREHGGAVLSTAIDKFCYVSVRRLPPFFEHRTRVVYSRIESVAQNSEIEHPAVRACLGALGIEDGLEIHHDGDLPARTGMGTSSAFVVGLLHALHAMTKRSRGPSDLASEATLIEQGKLRENVGNQDQIAAAYGGFHLVRFFQDGRYQLQPMATPPGRLDSFQACLHLYFTGFARTASEIAAHQISNIPRRTAELTDLQAMVDEGERILIGSGALAEFGTLLHHAWSVKRRLSDRVSTSETDAIYEHARRSGALGGKLLGAGGGGFFLFFVEPDRSADFCRRMSPMLRVPFTFPARGSEVVLANQETAAAAVSSLQATAT